MIFALIFCYICLCTASPPLDFVKWLNSLLGEQLNDPWFITSLFLFNFHQPTKKACPPACAQEKQAFLMDGISAQWLGRAFRLIYYFATVVPELGGNYEERKKMQ